MRVVLDTSALYYPRALAALRSGETHGPTILPAVVFLERARQLGRLGLDGPGEMARFASAGGLELEPFGPLEAARAFQRAPPDDAVWRRVARDAMIAGHVREADVLWTANARDFLALGLGAAQVLDVRAL